ncbi:M23 family metallopeptidase [Neobacillus drentensis]|uniref:M23 family metallopeptidase n=1 Tax=Neobacillus drentensis TaxID=220684 RepID=UPI001F2CBC1B|nr:M23 family metallopeptidase [Neobacillus drentensis]ULT55823.1 M23 family metallopeptidase [Neobacillus drentensis]
MGMARSTPEEIRRRIAKRKKEQGTNANSSSPERQITWPGYDEHDDFKYTSPSDTGGGDAGHPLFKKEVFFFKILASALLFLAVAILFRNHTGKLEPARDFITSQMDKDFKFAVVSNWYEEKFGKPLALLPFTDEKTSDNKTVADNQNLSVPAMGKILENFEKNGQGIMIETSKGAPVQAINDGLVTFAGVKEGIGKTVIIQHSDKSETWYGNLDEVKVKLYEYVGKRDVVGTVSTSAGEDKTKGKYYFAIKKDDNFIDPIQVIRFD